ncbi:PmbA/TldA family metallopeptidase [Blastococcus brunescens]|uniref:DNA gyrase modulator n=1 Tax=Blastococcus brunescens TaxID=1564165 RepID=A0ABZ1AY47_9ACTN|nr:DNA gyrase modulator [Blastococcus sp. BMG 8361]WRL63493.1 DNA gyrase modulator [Blastococcus sp. BMG 8361]
MTRVSPQELVDKCLAASTADDQIAFVVESSEANLRWAANSLTTNGSMRSRQVVVISFVDGGAGMAAGTVTRTGTPDVAELVAASEQAARDAGPAEDAVPLISDPRPGAATGTPPPPRPRSASSPISRRTSDRRSGRRAPAMSCCTASPSTSWRRPTSAARPACGCGTTSRPAGWSSTARAPTSAAPCGRAWARGTSATSRWPTSRRTSSARWGGRSAGWSCPPGGTRRCCHHRRSAT